jgi:hypothetical protein
MTSTNTCWPQGSTRQEMEGLPHHQEEKAYQFDSVTTSMFNNSHIYTTCISIHMKVIKVTLSYTKGLIGFVISKSAI